MNFQSLNENIQYLLLHRTNQKKSNRTYRVFGFQTNLMKFSNLHIVWTAALPDTLSRDTTPKLQTKKVQLFFHKKLRKMKHHHDLSNI